MPSANSVAGLMKWVQREEWREAFSDLLDRHLGRACRSANIEPEDLASLIDDRDFGTLWGCAFEDFLSRDLDDGRNIVDDYLKRRGWKESASNRAYMAGLRSSVMSLYEVSEIVPGESFLARDLVRGGDPVRVSERSATKSLRQWDQIAARLIDISGKTVMGGGVLAFDRQLSEEVLAALSRAQKTARKESIKFMKSVGRKTDQAELDQLVGDTALLKASAFLFTTIWLRNFLDHVTHAVPPQISNSDGEPLEFQSLHYPLLAGATPEAVGSVLTSIPELDQENEHFWNWVSGKAPKHGTSTRPPRGQTFVTTMDDGRIVLGNLELKGRTLILSVNSRARAERGRALLDKVLTGLVREPLVETQTVEQMLAARGDAQPKTSSPLLPEDERAVIHKTLDDHYGRMLDEPIPALGNVTPLKAVKTAKGREKVIAWLKTIENHSAKMPKGDPMATYDFTWLWQELGLADRRR
jgi:hypothetical protein